MRVYTSVNLTPIRSANPYWHGPADPDANGQPQYLFQPTFHDPLVAMGYDECFFLYNGTLNRAPIWAGLSGDPLKVGANFDWSKGGQCSFPPHIDAVQACAQLAVNPGTFGFKSRPFLPIVFDIEDDGSKDAAGNSVFDQTMNYGMTATPEQRRIAAANMLAGIRAVKAVNGSSPVWWYDFPSLIAAKDAATEAAKLDLLAAMAPVAAELDGACPSFYYWNVPAQNPDWQIPNAEEMTGLIRTYFPTLQDSRIAAISPAYQIYWNDPKLTPLQGKPVNIVDWKRFVDFLDREGWDVLLWSDNLTWGTQYLPHCQYLASKAR